MEDFKDMVEKDPFGHLLGIRLDKVEPGYAKTRVKVRGEFQNFSGYVHGGLIFSLADQAFAAASNSLESLALALQMSINYFSPPAVEDELTAEARQIHLGKKISVYRIKVKDSSGKLIADCQGTVYQKKRGHK
jgi:acyl-CoA thioesterase